MSGPPTRRRVLQLGAAVGSALCTGCLGASSVTVDTPDTQSTTTKQSVTTAGQSATTSSQPTDVTDWPTFQNDAGNTGASTGVRAVPENGDRHWRVRGRMSAPVVADGTIYVADYTEDRTLTARNVATGDERWQSPVLHGQVGTAPAVADDRVVHQSFGMIHAFDHDEGMELWRYDPGRGAPGAPVVADDTVYATNDSYQSDPATVMAVSVSDGTERWQSSVAGEHASSLAYRNGTVFVGSSDGFVVALDARDGTERWRFDAESGVTRALSAAGGAVYAADHAGNLYALNAETGESRWRTTLSEGASPSTPAVADGTAYVGTETGVFAVSADDGGIDWEFPTDGRAGTPTTDADTVYFGGTDWDDHSVHALDAESGRERWSVRTDPREEGDHTVVGVSGPPVPVEEQLFVVAADGLSMFEST